VPAVPTWLYLIRHGTTAWHKDGRVLGSRDIPLDADGVAQAEAVTSALAEHRIAEVVASPLMRAVRTAEAIGKRHRIEVARDPRLTDLRLGAWEGKPQTELVAHPDYRRMLAVPDDRVAGGESLRELAARARNAVDQIVADNPSGDAVAVVTHGAVIRALVLDYLGAPLEAFDRIEIATGSITALAFSGAAVKVVTVGWTPDLGRVTHG
jgi:broad specificity phosphatase PhoE